MKTLLKSFACFLVLCLAIPALAGSVKEYSADMVDVKNGEVVQKLAVTPDKIYSESFDVKGKRQAVAIIRRDQEKTYILMKETKTYIEIAFKKDKFIVRLLRKFQDKDVSMLRSPGGQKVGSDTVNGYKADKFKTTDKDTSVTSFNWIAPEFDPMPVRIEDEGGITEMRNIKTGSPDPALFEIPEGYKRDTQMEQKLKDLMDRYNREKKMEGLMDMWSRWEKMWKDLMDKAGRR